MNFCVRLVANMLVVMIGMTPVGHTSAQAPAADEAEASEARRFAVVVAGLPGDDEHAQLFDATLGVWKSWLRDVGGVADERLVVLGGAVAPESSEPARSATFEELAKTFERLTSQMTKGDSLWVLVLGHGHYDGRRAWLHVPGKDPEAADFARWLSSIPAGEQVVWLTHASSGWWVKPLARPGRIVIAATAAEQEENETEFPHALATVMKAKIETLDANTDGHVSLAELFRATVKETIARFERDKRLPTEHAILDDDGDGKGTEIDKLADSLDSADPANTEKPPPGTNPARLDGRAAAQFKIR